MLLGIFLLIVRSLFSKIEKKTAVNDELVLWLKELGRQMQTSNATVDEKLTRNMDVFNNRLDKTAYVIAELQRSMGEFSEIGRSMKDLQQFLSSPKLRGNIGEQILKELLLQYLPQDSFMLQHTFKTGEKVDAVIKTSQGLIPIDSKFPMENFRKMMEQNDEKELYKREFIKDVKKHIVDIHKKYILVDEGTTDYALMYIPAEAIYYEIINNSDLYDFAGEKRILPVSPMSFYAYLKAILMSFEGQKIQSRIQEVMILLGSMKKDYTRTDESIQLLNRHLTNAYNQSAQVSKSFGQLGQKLESTSLLYSETKQAPLLE